MLKLQITFRRTLGPSEAIIVLKLPMSVCYKRWTVKSPSARTLSLFDGSLQGVSLKVAINRWMISLISSLMNHGTLNDFREHINSQHSNIKFQLEMVLIRKIGIPLFVNNSLISNWYLQSEHITAIRCHCFNSIENI